MKNKLRILLGSLMIIIGVILILVSSFFTIASLLFGVFDFGYIYDVLAFITFCLGIPLGVMLVWISKRKVIKKEWQKG